MRFFIIFVLTLSLAACTSLQRGAHMHSAQAPQPLVFHYQDGGNSIYYTFHTKNADLNKPIETVLFFYGGSGCPSWKSMMPHYVDGLTHGAKIFALNKRFVADRSTGWLDCGE